VTSPLPRRKPLMLIRQCAEDGNLSAPMIYKLIRQGDLPVVRFGSSVRVHPEDWERLIEERRSRRNGK